MEKQQAIEKIKELEDSIAELKAIVDKPEEPAKNVVTQWPTVSETELHINGKWAASLYPSEEQGRNKLYSVKTGREASMFLGWGDGTWYNEQGEEVSGYLYYEPNK
jgi:hypothetical protein